MKTEFPWRVEKRELLFSAPLGVFLLQMNTTKGQRGGKREGAGRPKGSSKLYAFRADKDLAHFIDTQENKTQFIKDCILSCMEKGEQNFQLAH